MIVFRFFYNSVTFFVAILAAVVFLFYRRGRRRYWERFGFWGAVADRPITIWFHAASAGEVGGLLPLIELLKSTQPQLKTLLTCTSPTGLDRAKDFFTNKHLLPFDNLCFYKRALDKISPQALFITETEIWPELMNYLASRKLPVYLINARVSADFQSKFYFLKFFVAPSLLKIKHFYCQDLLSAERLVGFGVKPENTTVTGNTKFDALAAFVQQSLQTGNQTVGKDLPVLVLGSLRVGEEEIWLPLLQQFAGRYKIIIVPRHLEFVAKLKTSLQQAKLAFQLRSDFQDLAASVRGQQILLVDSIGELVEYYQLADLAFVGGTLVPGIGGHNPLEPLAFRVPVIMGSHNANQQSLTADLEQLQACRIIQAPLELPHILLDFLENPSKYQQQALRGQEYLISQLGAAEKIRQVIQEKVSL